MKHFLEWLKDFGRDAPVFAIVFYNWFIGALPNILLILAFVYAILNITYLIWKWRKEAKEKK